ncbi:MAG: hypothetical protein ACKOCM_10075 [Cyanobacteriota bacterium]
MLEAGSATVRETTPDRPPRRPWSWLLLGLLGLGAPWATPLRAAPLPSAERSEVPRRCPALLPSYENFLEPMPLRPQDVPAKNAKGCLSPADAIYGTDGCPKKLCPQPKGLGL